mgnify:CR=1 FL=1
MPSKGHKIAAKQSKLNNRRRRAKSQRQGETSPNESPGISQSSISTNPVTESPTSATNEPILQNEESKQVSSKKNSTTSEKAANVSVLTSNFLAGELRQIGVLSVVMVIILAALTFVLN